MLTARSRRPQGPGRSGLRSDISAFEVNEAFAPVPLAWHAEIGAADGRMNPVGGAIALGHPLGASGAVMTTLSATSSIRRQVRPADHVRGRRHRQRHIGGTCCLICWYYDDR